MKKALMILAALVSLSACSRPETPPPTTPIDAPTVETTTTTETLTPTN